MSNDSAGCFNDPELENLAENLDGYFHLLMNKYQDTIFKVAYNMLLRNPEDAEEVTIDTFFNAYQALPKLIAREQNIRLRPWLLTIVTNNCYNHKRDKRRLKRAPSGISSLNTNEGNSLVESNPSGQYPSPEYEVVQREKNNALWHALKQFLTEYQFKILILKYIGGLSDSEIASVLKRKPDAIRKARERAMQTLQDTVPRDDANKESSDQWLERLMMSISKTQG